MSGFWPFLLALLLTAHFTRNYFYRGLNKYPGPLLAKFTHLWRFIDVCGRRPDQTHQELHRKYGDVVRLGPNVLSFSTPAAMKSIYGLNKGFVKSGFYPVQQATSNGRRLPSLFSSTDETFHAQLRRSVNHAFSMSAIKDYETLVNETIDIFLSQTGKLYAQTGQPCDIGLWLQYFAFDVIGQITYSKRHGFIDQNEDIDGMVSYLDQIFRYVAPIGQMPWLDLLMLKNPLVLWLDKLGFKLFAFPVASFAKKQIQEQINASDSKKSPGIARADLLSQFLGAQVKNPGFMTDERVLTMAVGMTFAGSETTGISLASIFYYLLQNQDCYNTLISEISSAQREGTIGKSAINTNGCLVTWSEAQLLPYLDAVVKESFRLHPAAGLPLERITPPSGIQIGDYSIPGNTIVGVSAWVLHQHAPTFDPLSKYPVTEFHPARWLDTDLAPLQTRAMEGCMFQFGAGPRTCIGKNISLLEIYKLVPNLLLRFEIEFGPRTVARGGWKLRNAWFVKVMEFEVRFRRRPLATRDQ